MARTINQIYESMLSTAAGQPALKKLQSSSVYAIFKAFFYVVAVNTYALESLLDEHKKEVNELKDKYYSTTSLWWNDQMLNVFQFDSTDTNKGVLKVDSNTLIPYYSSVDASKRIIRYVATKQTEDSKQVNIKVSKDDGNGSPAQLTLDELNAAASFVNAKMNVGYYTKVISFPADQLRVNIDVYYDGQYVLSNIKQNVTEAIKQYLKNLKYNGDIEAIRLIDYVQNVQGVTSAYINNIALKPDGSSYTEFSRSKDTQAGYAALNEVDSIFNFILQS